MTDRSEKHPWRQRLAIAGGVLVAVGALAVFLLSRADGPVFVFGGGPLRSGEQVALNALDWNGLDELHELEMEIVAAKSSRILWFSVLEGVPYVACDLDCLDGRLSRWPRWIEDDDRVVIRIAGKRAEGRLTHVRHDTPEYRAVKAGRARKYSGEAGGRAAAETAAHGMVVDLGEELTGRSSRAQPGDRLYRLEPRSSPTR